MPLELKQGDTFSYSGPVALTDGEGAPIDTSDWKIICQVKFDDDTRQSLTVTRLSGDNVRLFSNTTQTWPEGVALIDVQLTSPSGIKASTKTHKFKVLQDISRG
jgi:hypothetical protein